MPTLNIPPVVRFALYITSALGSVFVIYAIQKGWAGDAENQLWLGISGLLAALAASKTPISTSDDEAGDIGVLEAVVIVFVVIVILVLLGALR